MLPQRGQAGFQGSVLLLGRTVSAPGGQCLLEGSALGFEGGKALSQGGLVRSRYELARRPPADAAPPAGGAARWVCCRYDRSLASGVFAQSMFRKQRIAARKQIPSASSWVKRMP